jgi:PAS domain S-box-containing protein
VAEVRAPGPPPSPPGERGRESDAPAAAALATMAMRVVRICATTAIVLGGAYLLAWLGGAAARWAAAGVLTMKTNMSVALVLAGSALGLLNGRPAPRWRATAMAASAVVLLLGVLSLSEHLFRVDLGIDQLLATEPPGAPGTASPNRMGPTGATTLALLGVGLLALAWRRRAALYVGLATCVVVLVPAVGYLYGIDPFYATARTGIAWPTVIALLSLGVGLVLAHAHHAGVVALSPDDPGGVLVRRLLLPSVLIPLALGYLKHQGQRHGLFDAPTGTGLFALSLILLFSALLWRSAAQLSATAATARCAADALRDREERLRLFVEHAPAAVAMFDRELRYLAASRRFASDLRVRLEDLVGRRHYDVFPEVPDRWKEIHQRCLAGAVEQCEEDAFLRSDGTVDWIRWEIHPWRDAAGVIGGLMLFSEVITERKRALEQLDAERRAVRHSEDRLRAAKQRLESLLENSPLAVVEWSSVDFRISRWSEEATRVFGWTAEDVAEKRIDELNLVHPEDWPLVEKVMADMLSGARPRNVNKNRNLRKDGSVIHCEWYNSTVTDASGKLIGVLSLVLDVTDRKRTEEALREADRRKSEFLGVLSHELRNPLAPIRNGIHLLDRAPPGSEQAARAKEVIRRQTAHLARLVDDLLDVTRIGRGKIDLQRRRLDLRDVVAKACEDHRTVFDARKMELRVEASEAVWVDGDETRVAQIAGNLLQNAAKFGVEGGAVTVRVGVGEGQAEVRVRDDGMGMSPDLMQRLFVPFVQADGSLARTSGGLGLGLALVKGLVELHGGSARASSAGLGLGSEFVVRLPLAAASQPSAPPVVHADRSAALEILVIEDNPDAAETLADVLRLEGHRVWIALNGAAGIASAREHRPDVVLCDIGLPDVDGYEVARTLRRDRTLDAVRLIALTGYAQPDDLARAEGAGFDAHLAKPPPLATLLAMLGPRRAG